MIYLCSMLGDRGVKMDPDFESCTMAYFFLDGRNLMSFTAKEPSGVFQIIVILLFLHLICILLLLHWAISSARSRDGEICGPSNVVWLHTSSFLATPDSDERWWQFNDIWRVTHFLLLTCRVIPFYPCNNLLRWIQVRTVTRMRPHSELYEGVRI